MKQLLFPVVFFAACTVACNDASKTEDATADVAARTPQVQTQNVTYKDDTTTLQGMVAYDGAASSKRPAV